MYDSHHIDDSGRTWSIRELLASSRPRVQRCFSTASLWGRTSHRRSWGSDLPSPAYVLAMSGLRRSASVPDDAPIQYEDTVADHVRRLSSLMRAYKRGEHFDPVIIGPDGAFWDGKHRLAVLYACDVPTVEVLDFSRGDSALLGSAITLRDLLAPRLLQACTSGLLRNRFDKAQPYRHVFIPNVFEPVFADQLVRDMKSLPWRLATTDFYEQYEDSLIDTERPYTGTALDALRELGMSPEFAELISSITSQGPLEVVDVACHRSTVGQQIGIHNDFYPDGEVCRFTIHLNPEWALEDGGLFVTFAEADISAMKAAYLPEMNSALLFEISPASFHAITEVTTGRPRYSIVISFVRRRAMTPLDEKVAELAKDRIASLSALRPEIVDVRSLSRLRTKRCTPVICGGACCRDGAGLLPGEIQLLDRIARVHSRELADLGVTAPGVQRVDHSMRTSLVTDSDAQRHCSWLTPDGKCSLQVLGENQLQDPFIYKPLACILMPLRVRSLNGARILTADVRTREGSYITDPCIRGDNTAGVLEGVEKELAFVNEIWDVDVRSLVDAANQNPFANGEPIGAVAATERHVLWAIEGDTQRVEVLKVSRASIETDSQEAAVLQKLTGRWFPESADHGMKSKDSVRMSLVGGHIPLDLWMRVRRSEVEIIDVARDLLRALAALERLGVHHLDLAARNVLVQPENRTIVIVDFEDSHDETCGIKCAGGEFGYAAPEQYLNYLGSHTRLTESFFVGAFIYHAFAQLSRRRQRAFPFEDLGCVPFTVRGLVTALTGDPAEFYAPHTRLSASAALDCLEAECTESPSIRPLATPAIEAEQRRLDGPDGGTLLIRRRGLTLLRGETVIDRWDGLVDVMNTTATWTDPFRIGPLLITSGGFVRSGADKNNATAV